jgi:hypothetical protein
MRSHAEHLLARAHGHWSNHEPLPLDLFYALLGEGIDVATEERKFTNNQERN